MSITLRRNIGMHFFTRRWSRSDCYPDTIANIATNSITSGNVRTNYGYRHSDAKPDGNHPSCRWWRSHSSLP